MGALEYSLTGLLGIYGLYLLVHWVALLRLKPIPVDSAPRLSISIVLPARNAAAHLALCLETLLRQEYPANLLEIVLIDDQSEDATPSIGLHFQKQAEAAGIPFQFLQTGGQGGKKAALALGIAHAKGEIILTTDADTWRGNRWVTHMAAAFSNPSVTAVSGPVRLEDPKARPFSEMQTLESAGLVGMGAAAIALGYPTLANGANLAFRKSAFQAVGGYSGIDHVASGDDELLLHKLHHTFPGSVRFQKHPEAIVSTEPAPNWADFRRQRIRWVSKGRAYRNRILRLGQWIAFLGQCAFLLALTLLPIFPENWKYYLGAPLLFKWLPESLMLAVSLKMLRNVHMMRWLPLEWLLYPIYVIWIAFAGTFAKSYEWKGRRVR